jgi:BTB/POZ domain-containing protein 9
LRHELVDKIRLPLMKLEELFNDVRESNLVSADVILDAIKLKHESNDMELRYRGVLCNFNSFRNIKIKYFFLIEDPNENIANNRYNAIVIKGEFKSALLDGDTSNYDFDRGFTYHPIDENNSQNNAIIVKLGNPSIFNQIKLLLWDKDCRLVLF